MFDVRPVDETGDLDWERIKRVEKIMYVRTSRSFKKTAGVSGHFSDAKIKPSWVDRDYREPRFIARKKPKNREVNIFQLNKNFKSGEIPLFHEVSPDIAEQFKPDNKAPARIEFIKTEFFEPYGVIAEIKDRGPEEYIKEEENHENHFNFSDFFLPTSFTLSFGFEKLKKAMYSFSGIALIITFAFIAVPFMEKSLDLKSRVLGVSQEGYDNLEAAINNAKSKNFESSLLDFQKASENFSRASEDLNNISGALVDASRFIPFISKFSSGKNIMEAGKHVALAGESISETLKVLSSLENPVNNSQAENFSFLEIFQATEKNLATARDELESANNNLGKVKVEDLPSDKQSQFMEIKKKLPEALALIGGFLDNSDIFIDLLGGNGPRKYLFLFQNNQEMRPTGGFIGSYGLLDIYDGRVRKFFINGIFDPDGQLTEKIVPPGPIQKISAAWSLHDSNWWPDFPVSARKAIVFYEKTGGPTVDGIITLTPEVLKKLLALTGPIELPDYNMTIDSNNFIETIQQEAEINYDKELNQPKKILADLAPVVLDRLFNAKSFDSVSRTLGVLSSSLNQKQILLYSQNEELQKIISREGWSGEILSTRGDYLSVINTNINGYKTDGVITENIEHSAEIQEDGTVIDNVAITRKHTGGNTQYFWWNKVNADYMRLYVPLGSKLLEVEGQTREFTEPPLDYDALGFKRDPDVQREEQNMDINGQTGTRIYDESGKTVFANWVYVSPQETVTVTYKYFLPFRINFENQNNPVTSYSLLAQKQSGSIGSQFSSAIKYPSFYETAWRYPNDCVQENNELKTQTDLETDKFIGAVFVKKDFIDNK